MSTLALSKRPKNLLEVVGQDTTVKNLVNLFMSKKTQQIPHFYILSGVIGTGKTTLARILSNILQSTELDKEPNKRNKDFIEQCSNTENIKYDIREINASDKNGIDDIRTLIEQSKFIPSKPSRSKVIIFDEAHQLTTQAQNALLSHVEELPKHVYYIFCTSNIGKLLASVKRRAFVINLETLSKQNIEKLVQSITNDEQYSNISNTSTQEFIEALYLHEINTAGLVLQALEKYLSGFSIDDACSGTQTENNLKTIELCRSINKGDWKSCTEILKDVNNTDVQALKNIALGYLKKVLLGTTNVLVAVKLSKAIKTLNESGDNSADFSASVCLACNHMNAPVGK